MTIWPPKRDALTRPVYHSLARALVRAVEAGEVAPGTRLPTHRALAFDLGLSVQTVSRAYEELARLGIISGVVGRGSFVTAGSTGSAQPWHQPNGWDGIIDCSMLLPVTDEMHAELTSQVFAELSSDLPHKAIFSFRPRATLYEHCCQAQKWLATCGVEVLPDGIIPTNGNTEAMTLALMTAAMPGDLVVTEATGHHTLTSLTSVLGLKVAGLPMDEEGILPEALERACQNSGVKALFVMPSGAGPTAAVMSEGRRDAVVSIARKHDVWIIENDAWGPLDPERSRPLAARAPERTFYFTGFSKCILPGLRIGWLVVPEGRISAARTRQLVTNWMATPLIAEIASRWISDGTAARLLDWQREHLLRRNRLAVRIFDGVPFKATAYGLNIWLPLPEPWREEDFVSLARLDGVAVAAGASFAIGGSSRPQGIRVCLGAGTEADLEKGLKVISRLVRSAPEPGLLAI